ncbi:MAG TPA: hypothetical protein VK386_05255 [Acidimicrobiales bacterium]|nr:hypothetical protein [Acidimicrobiales bacterium]
MLDVASGFEGPWREVVVPAPVVSAHADDVARRVAKPPRRFRSGRATAVAASLFGVGLSLLAVSVGASTSRTATVPLRVDAAGAATAGNTNLPTPTSSVGPFQPPVQTPVTTAPEPVTTPTIPPSTTPTTVPGSAVSAGIDAAEGAPTPTNPLVSAGSAKVAALDPSVPAEVTMTARGIILAIDQKAAGRFSIPVTVDNIELLATWMAAEGGMWADNPLNTDLDAGRYPHQFTSGGVDTGTPIYPSLEVGIEATASTLLGNPAYAHILDVLQAGSASCSSFATAVIKSPWAASHYGYDPAGFCGSSPAGLLSRTGHHHGKRAGRRAGHRLSPPT